MNNIAIQIHLIKKNNSDATEENIKDRSAKFSVGKFKFLTPNFYLWLKKQCPLLDEEDFYPPEDNRVYCSGVSDIENGDNFRDYAKDFYDELLEDGFYD
jgi:hypothetical protein